MRVLIAGISSPVGRHVAEILVRHHHEVVGVDRRPWPDARPEIRVHPVDIRKRQAEEVFRTFRPEVVIHMATVTHLERSTHERYRINLHGTRSVFDACARHGAERAVFVGRHTLYGAAPDAPLYHREDSPPMASTTFPELADLVAADLYASQALWRQPALDTVVLRIVYQLGPTSVGTLPSYLRGPRVPTVLGFDPLFQFMHERDMARAVAQAATHPGLRGVFNVAGPRPMPLSDLIRGVGRRRVPVPEPVLGGLLGRFGLPRLPRGAIEHLKHPVVVDDAAFREATGFSAHYDGPETMEAFARAHPV
ncbi:MAG TPA: NAD-dependent epimerase/dehydratase family protein [Myxococcales bacterium LLY-WYZ-16_1]|nr:NAD-dependent epimerase/dehydratase family protein [Myxococcales bacterium LLY-WYZ-16_1]